MKKTISRDRIYWSIVIELSNYIIQKLSSIKQENLSYDYLNNFLNKDNYCQELDNLLFKLQSSSHIIDSLTGLYECNELSYDKTTKKLIIQQLNKQIKYARKMHKKSNPNKSEFSEFIK